MSSTTKVLITGCNRGKQSCAETRSTIINTKACFEPGIGKGLLEIYLKRPHHIIIGAVRDLSTVQALNLLPKASSTTFIIIKIDSGSDSDPSTAIKDLQSNHPEIQNIDLVIANAGILKELPFVKDVTSSSMKEHYHVNVIAPTLLFQAVLPLLEKSIGTDGQEPRFVTVSSMAASIGAMEACPFPNAAYGPTKAALNYITKKIHTEHEGIIAIALDPG